RRSSRACSRTSTAPSTCARPRSPAPAWGSRSPAATCAPTAATSPSPRGRASGPPSPCGSRWRGPATTEGGPHPTAVTISLHSWVPPPEEFRDRPRRARHRHERSAHAPHRPRREARLPAGRPGPARDRRAAGGAVPRRGGDALRRVRGRGRVLRDLRLPHHHTPAGEPRAGGPDPLRPLLCQAGAPHSAGRSAGRCAHLARFVDLAVPAADAQRGGRGDRHRAVRAELLLRPAGHGLPGRVHSVGVPALLVARHRGAVLPALAGAAGGGVLAVSAP